MTPPATPPPAPRQPWVRRANPSAWWTAAACAVALAGAPRPAWSAQAIAQDADRPAGPSVQDGAAADVEAHLAALQEEVRRLRAERDELRVRLAEAIEMLRNLGYAPPRPVVQEPSDPMASPLAVMQTLRRRARLELSTIPREKPEDLEVYRRQAQQWAEKMNAALSGQRQWLVRVLDVTPPTSSAPSARGRASVQLFDPATGAVLSLPMDVPVPNRTARRMAQAGPQQGWTAHVRLEPQVRFNSDRLEAGPFDHPPFLAPMVEATLQVHWDRFEPADVPEGFFPPLADELPGTGVQPADADDPAGAPRARQGDRPPADRSDGTPEPVPPSGRQLR
ncbi:MAG: hypothetical protein KatS3mg103_1450 [Phycisphaerales bacterium]|nr:MAG: hypothetical protein KatS3mg103_1450 [Phycisphaerales bacterium]